MLFLHLCEFFKLCSSNLWLFLEFDCLKYYGGKVRKVFYEKIPNTTMLTVYWYIIRQRVKNWLTIAYFLTLKPPHFPPPGLFKSLRWNKLLQGTMYSFYQSPVLPGKTLCHPIHFLIDQTNSSCLQWHTSKNNLTPYFWW